jgi:hypothetical protein
LKRPTRVGCTCIPSFVVEKAFPCL